MISDKVSRFFMNERYAITNVLGLRIYSILFALLSTVITVLYLFLLPSLPLGGFVIYAINYITPIQIVFAFLFGTLTGLVIVMNIYAWSINLPSDKRLTLGSILASLVNGLCCTPVIPSLLALAGASTPFLYQISPRIQAFFEFNYPYFYLLSTAILLLSLHYLSKSISCCKNKG